MLHKNYYGIFGLAPVKFGARLSKPILNQS